MWHLLKTFVCYFNDRTRFLLRNDSAKNRRMTRPYIWMKSFLNAYSNARRLFGISGGLEKSQNPAYIIIEWSLKLFFMRLMHENENAPPEFISTHCDSRTQLVQLPTYSYRACVLLRLVCRIKTRCMYALHTALQKLK